MFGKSSFIHRRTDTLISIALFLLALLPRSIGLNIFSTADEASWLDSSRLFLDAVSHSDWQGTIGIYGHPGITTQWSGTLGVLAYHLYHSPDIVLQSLGSGSSDILLSEIYHRSLGMLSFARYPIVLLTSFFIVVVYALLKKSLGRRVALLAALLLAFDPFFVALSRLLITDGLHASFALISILCLGVALGSDKWHWYALSGMSAGLAALSKSPAFFALGALVLVLSTIVYILRSHRSGNWRLLLVRLATWYGAMALCVFIFWPSMWVQPLASLEFVFNNLTNVAVSGRWVTNVGPFFYPAVLLFRGSPLVLVGALATLACVRKWPNLLAQRRIDQKTIWLLCLWGMVGTYVLMFSFGSWKNDFYMLPVCLAVDILGAIGLVAIFDTVVSRWHIPGRRQQLKNIGLGLAVVLQVVLCVNHSPYYLTYYNPVLGGWAAAAKHIPWAVGHGEGLEQVVDYLNSQENVENQYAGISAIGFFGCLYYKHVKVNELRFPPPRETDMLRFPFTQLDYLVLYIASSYWREWPYPYNEFIASNSPEFVVHIKGIPYASVYRVPKKAMQSLPPEATPAVRTYENGLRLTGYKTGPIVEVEQSGPQLLPVTVYWQADDTCDSSHWVVFKLRNDSYTIWGTERIPSPCKNSPDLWQNDSILPSQLALDVLPGTPPGSYTLEMILLKESTGEEMEPIDASTVSLGTVEIPPHPGLDPGSLGMEHTVSATISDQIQLLGYNITGGAEPGEILHLTIFWQCLADMKNDYKVFVHVVDQQGNILAQKDGEPVTGFYSTSQWQVGEIIRDQYEIAFSDDSGIAATGLRIGMYLPSTGERLPVALSDGAMPESRAVSIP